MHCEWILPRELADLARVSGKRNPSLCVSIVGVLFMAADMTEAQGHIARWHLEIYNPITDHRSVKGSLDKPRSCPRHERCHSQT